MTIPLKGTQNLQLSTTAKSLWQYSSTHAKPSSRRMHRQATAPHRTVVENSNMYVDSESTCNNSHRDGTKRSEAAAKCSRQRQQAHHSRSNCCDAQPLKVPHRLLYNQMLGCSICSPCTISHSIHGNAAVNRDAHLGHSTNCPLERLTLLSMSFLHGMLTRQRHPLTKDHMNEWLRYILIRTRTPRHLGQCRVC